VLIDIKRRIENTDNTTDSKNIYAKIDNNECPRIKIISQSCFYYEVLIYITLSLKGCLTTAKGGKRGIKRFVMTCHWAACSFLILKGLAPLKG
jgi:hypothetical protein